LINVNDRLLRRLKWALEVVQVFLFYKFFSKWFWHNFLKGYKVIRKHIAVRYFSFTDARRIKPERALSYKILIAGRSWRHTRPCLFTLLRTIFFSVFCFFYNWSLSGFQEFFPCFPLISKLSASLTLFLYISRSNFTSNLKCRFECRDEDIYKKKVFTHIHNIYRHTHNENDNTLYSN